MPAISPLQALLSQFQIRYPMGCLSAELLTIHQERYVIRAVIQIGGLTLATAMAADANLEAAEDRAKLRLLEQVGAPASTDAAAPTTAMAAPVQPLPALQPDLSALPKSTFDATFNNATSNNATSGADLPSDSSTLNAASAHSSSLPSWEAEFQSVTQLNSTAVEQPAELEPAKASVTGLRTSKAERLKRSAEPAPAPPTEPVESPTEPVLEQPTEPLAAPADRSEEIMRIGIEMKRLGWSTEQGREYLKRTYGKASRSKLDDAELLDFLHYLEIQSSPLQAQTPF